MSASERRDAEWEVERAGRRCPIFIHAIDRRVGRSHTRVVRYVNLFRSGQVSDCAASRLSALSGIPGAHPTSRVARGTHARRAGSMTSSLASASAPARLARGGASVARVRSAGRRVRRASRAPPRAALEEGPVARRADADDDDAPSRPGALSVVDSTDDVFAEFCASQVELVARALGRGASACLPPRPGGVAGDDHLRLQEVASFPQKPRRRTPPRGTTTSTRTPPPTQPATPRASSAPSTRA